MSCSLRLFAFPVSQLVPDISTAVPVSRRGPTFTALCTALLVKPRYKYTRSVQMLAPGRPRSAVLLLLINISQPICITVYTVHCSVSLIAHVSSLAVSMTYRTINLDRSSSGKYSVLSKGSVVPMHAVTAFMEERYNSTNS